ncbi:MAG: hypothetical protein ACLTTP_05485 [Alistipes ihumii]
MADLSSLAGSVCHTAQSFTLDLSEREYEGSFGVVCELAEGAGTLAYGTASNTITGGRRLTLRPATIRSSLPARRAARR